jgi:ankyrin repeat protein
MKIQLFLICILISTLSSYSQNLGPGYEFSLFNNTQNADLAKAVEKEDTLEIKNLISESDVNLQESKYGVTLLELAIANGKLRSVKVLLEEGADINIPDFSNSKPIHEATKFIKIRKNSFEILDLLLQYGANPNDTALQKHTGSFDFYVPLMGAVGSIECTKLLLKYNANLYIKKDSSYLIWERFLEDDINDGIYVARYLIIDRQMAVPNPITYSTPNKNPLDIFYFLSKEHFRNDLNKERGKQEIIDYLNKTSCCCSSPIKL